MGCTHVDSFTEYLCDPLTRIGKIQRPRGTMGCIRVDSFKEYFYVHSVIVSIVLHQRPLFDMNCMANGNQANCRCTPHCMRVSGGIGSLASAKIPRQSNVFSFLFVESHHLVFMRGKECAFVSQPQGCEFESRSSHFSFLLLARSIASPRFCAEPSRTRQHLKRTKIHIGRSMRAVQSQLAS